MPGALGAGLRHYQGMEYVSTPHFGFNGEGGACGHKGIKRGIICSGIYRINRLTGRKSPLA